MGRAVHLVASGEPAWAGAALKVPRRCMGRLRGFGSTGAALFYGEAPNPEFSMKDEYEVGYGKPPKATRFGNRPQPRRSSKSRTAKEVPIDLAAAINRPMTITRNGKPVRMHPHEAMMHGLAKSALRGKLRAIKEFFSECKKAGVLDTPPARQTTGVLSISNEIPLALAVLLVKTAGPPPWHDDLYDQCKAEYESDSDNIERLLEKEKARRDEKAK
jgi:hypothetical protein